MIPFGMDIRLVESGTVIESDNGERLTVDEQTIVRRNNALFVTLAHWNALKAASTPSNRKEGDRWVSVTL